MDDSASPHSAQVIAFLPRDPVAETIRRLLEEEGLKVLIRHPDGPGALLSCEIPAAAWVLDDRIDPVELSDAVQQGAIPASAPVFVLSRRLPDRERYLAWLEAGAWDILKVPLEGVALALRLGNILGGGGARQRAMAAAHGYSWENLIQVADETLALARRYDRPLHCVAIDVDRGGATEPDGTHFARRLARGILQLTRRSDLIGIADPRTLVLLLPDTDEAGTETFVHRLEESIQDRLRKWGMTASVRTQVVSGGDSESGHELLDRATRTLRNSSH